jgi:hypothetical protein
MPATTIRGVQILNGSVQRADMNTATSGQAVVTKIVQGSNITIASSGIDPGTGDVTVSATVPVADPGAWTTPSFATGWSDGGQCAFRVQVLGAISTVFARGMAVQAAAAASLAFTLPSGARPSAARTCMVSGYQTDPDSSLVLVLYAVTIGTDGTLNIYPIVKNTFVWPLPANQQNVYLDSLNFAL